MSVAIAAVPTSGTAVITAFRIEVTGAEDTDISTYDEEDTPAEAAFVYYIEMSESSVVKGTSHRFTVDSENGNHVWDNVIVPDAGTYTFTLRKEGGASVATTNVTVS